MRARALILMAGLAGCSHAPPAEPVGEAAYETAVEVSADGSLNQEWRQVSTETGKIADIDGLRQLALEFPDSGSIHLRLLQALFAQNDAAGAVEEALWLAKRGYVFSEGGHQQMLTLAGGSETASSLSKFRAANLPRIENSELVATVPAEYQLAESVVLDPMDNFIVSTVISRQIVSLRPDCSWRSIAFDNAGSLSGMVFDQSGDALWIASGDLGMTPEGSKQFHGLLKLSEGAPHEPEYFAAPEGVSLSDITSGPYGTVFASDPIGGGVYHLIAGSVQELVAPGTFRSPQGLAMSADNSRLYVSDYRYGIAVINLDSGKISRLNTAKPMILDGIDGMWMVGNRLIGVQNGMNPMRIVEISLTPDGYNAGSMRVLERGHSSWTEPLGGTVHKGALYYVATGQWDRFGDGGLLREGKQSSPTEVRRLPL